FDLFFDEFLPSDLTDTEIEKIFYLKKNGFLFTLHYPIYDYSVKNSFIEELVDFSNKLEPLTVTIHFNKLTEDVLEFMLINLKKTIKLSIENVVDNINKYYDTDYLEFMKKNKKIYNIYSTFDIGHSFINNEDIITQFEKLNKPGVEISTMHIHNNDGVNDSHLSLDKGVINYKEIIAYIKEKKLNPIFVIEHWNDNLITLRILRELLN
ncbi:MAG TPA: TIM barrel protein, partial [Spirochaetota bacterium]|nr:TIM barrel protein [Spirochaetota bacterium]